MELNVNVNINLQVQLSKSYDEFGETVFKVFCPGQFRNFPHTLMMYKDGSVSKNIKYHDICTNKYAVSVAYNNDPHHFEIVNNSMVEYSDYNIEDKRYSILPYYYEILSIFFENNNIIVSWIYCNQTWGLFNSESQTWTGAVGQVENN